MGKSWFSVDDVVSLGIDKAELVQIIVDGFPVYSIDNIFKSLTVKDIDGTLYLMSGKTEGWKMRDIFIYDICRFKYEDLRLRYPSLFVVSLFNKWYERIEKYPSRQISKAPEQITTSEDEPDWLEFKDLQIKLANLTDLAIQGKISVYTLSNHQDPLAVEIIEGKYCLGSNLAYWTIRELGQFKRSDIEALDIPINDDEQTQDSLPPDRAEKPGELTEKEIQTCSLVVAVGQKAAEVPGIIINERMADTGDNVEYTDDFRSITKDGITYDLTPMQSQVIKLLYDEYPRCLTQHAILENIESRSTRLRDLFKPYMNVWRAFIEAGETKGTYRFKK